VRLSTIERLFSEGTYGTRELLYSPSTPVNSSTGSQVTGNPN
jgi:hypothetical protein